MTTTYGEQQKIATQHEPTLASQPFFNRLNFFRNINNNQCYACYASGRHSYRGRLIRVGSRMSEAKVDSEVVLARGFGSVK